MTTTTAGRRRLTPALLLAPLLLAACGTDTGSAASAPTSREAAEEPTTSDVTEAARVTPRLAVTYDGGVLVLDATTLEEVADLPVEGFARVNAAGDGRHVVVSSTGGFQVLDAGTWSEAHGDHAHHWTATPAMTDVVHPAEEPGHVVVHGGRTALFDDGTGRVVVLDSQDVADDAARTRELRTPSAHHGVAVELEDGSLVVSEGTEDERTGVRLLDADDVEVAASDRCPGVHGEAVAADEAVVIGCQDGVLVVADGAITKVQSPDAYGRIGNQAGSDVSPVVLGDYKTDADAELERPTRVSLVDTTTATMRLVDLPTSYTFRSLGRGPAGEALVLGTDGALHVVDPATGALVRSTPVVGAWEEPLDWQEPRPALHVLGSTAWVTDPATSSVHAVDLVSGELLTSTTLDVVPNEITSAAGESAPGHAHSHD